jgi:hypothetical protein
MFRRLDPALIVSTARTLERRIAERFPGSGLSNVSAELTRVAEEAAALSDWLSRPHRALRAAIGVALALLVGLLALGLGQVASQRFPIGFADWVQTTEALVNDIVFVGIAVYFLLGLETRRKRARALGALHVLRSLAHIVDMHQLTKDPERLLGAGPSTASSPRRTMTAFELTRYLDYSSEMLAIVSKIAALYVQELKDPVTLDAASAVEDLAGGLSRTMWQKIIILDRMLAGAEGRGVERAGPGRVEPPP